MALIVTPGPTMNTLDSMQDSTLRPGSWWNQKLRPCSKPNCHPARRLQVLACSGVTDAYQPVERHLRLLAVSKCWSAADIPLPLSRRMPW